MGLETRYPGEILIADDPANLVWGTCALGETYGSVESANVDRASDVDELVKCNGILLAAVLSNHKFQLTLKTIFTVDVIAPGIGESIDFPLAGISGRILKAGVEWEKKGHKMLSIEATSWDGLAIGTNDGQGTAHYEPTVGGGYSELT